MIYKTMSPLVMMSIKLNAILTGTLLMKETSLVAATIEKY
jgi:hypothetical protein